MVLTRRTVLRSSAAAAVAGSLTAGTRPEAEPGTRTEAVPAAVRDLEQKIIELMAWYRIPGAALGLHYRGRDYVRGFGVTDVSDPEPVGPDTVFRVASTTKTFTGTAVMRLVERGRLDLDRRVRDYLPGFRVADEAAAARVTVRQLLNHSAGWLGDYFLDTGSGDDALARYVAGMATLPQLTPPGRVFAYNNAALSLAGRLIEVATGRTYEDAARELLLDPLRLGHSAFTLDAVPDAQVAVPHDYDETGAPIPAPELFALPRAVNPAGGLISSVRDQLRWATFQLGDGGRLLTRRSLRAMQSRPGPGGTLFVETDGAGVTWWIRPTAEGPKIIQHGGDWPGQHSGFLLVPERDFALTVLTNAETGPGLTAELFVGDWALSRLLGLHNLPATPQSPPAGQVVPYGGTYTGQQVGFDGTTYTFGFDLVPVGGELSMRQDGEETVRLVFYRKDYVLLRFSDGSFSHQRANFVRGDDGEVAWFRLGGRLYRRGTTASTLGGQHRASVPPLSTLPHPRRWD